MRAPFAPPSLAALALLAAGCAAMGHDAAVPLVRERAITDLDCSDKEIRISEEMGGRYKAVGCGRKARYRTACVALTCEVHPDDGAPIPWRDRPEPTPGEPSPR
jgi:hypothetical protein